MHPTRLAPPAELLTDLRGARTGSETRLKEVLAGHGLRPLTGGFQNHVYTWDDPKAGPICIKLYAKGNHRRRVDREWAALTLLAEHHVDDVPRPLWLDQHHEVPAIGMTLLKGTPLLESTDRETALKGLARPPSASTPCPCPG